jgi:hypothetical protein
VHIGITVGQMTPVGWSDVLTEYDGMPAMPAHKTTLLYGAMPGMFDPGHRVLPDDAPALRVSFPTRTTSALFPDVYSARVRLGGGGGGGAAADAVIEARDAEWHSYRGNSGDMVKRDDQHYYGAPSGSVGIRTLANRLSLQYPDRPIEYEYAVFMSYDELPADIKAAVEACRAGAAFPTPPPLAAVRVAIACVEKWLLLAVLDDPELAARSLNYHYCTFGGFGHGPLLCPGSRLLNH